MAAQIKAAKTKKGYNELKAVTGSPPPAEINQLSADELANLTRLVSDSLVHHQAAMAEAEENLIEMAPRMLRGTVRRLLGAN